MCSMDNIYALTRGILDYSLNLKPPTRQIQYRRTLRKELVRTGPAPLNLPFSPGIKFGDLVFVSGQGPIDQNGKVVPGDVKSQTKTTLENFRRVLVRSEERRVGKEARCG